MTTPDTEPVDPLNRPAHPRVIEFNAMLSAAEFAPPSPASPPPRGGTELDGRVPQKPPADGIEKPAPRTLSIRLSPEQQAHLAAIRQWGEDSKNTKVRLGERYEPAAVPPPADGAAGDHAGTLEKLAADAELVSRHTGMGKAVCEQYGRDAAACCAGADAIREREAVDALCGAHEREYADVSPPPPTALADRVAAVVGHYKAAADDVIGHARDFTEIAAGDHEASDLARLMLENRRMREAVSDALNHRPSGLPLADLSSIRAVLRAALAPAAGREGGGDAPRE